MNNVNNQLMQREKGGKRENLDLNIQPALSQQLEGSGGVGYQQPPGHVAPVPSCLQQAKPRRFKEPNEEIKKKGENLFDEF